MKYNGSLQPLSGDLIQVEELIAGYAIVTLPEFLIESFAELPEVEYIEKPKRLYFSVLAGKQTSCIPEVTVRDPFLSGKGVLMAILESGVSGKRWKNENPLFMGSDIKSEGGGCTSYGS